MIKALSKAEKFIKPTQLLKEHKLVYELFGPAQFEQRLLTIPSLRWRVILYWRQAPQHVMDCRMDQVTWFSFSPWCCFQPSFLRLGSIIFCKSWVPFDLMYCGIRVGTDKFQKSLSLSLFCPETYLLMSLSTSRARYSGCTKQSWCMTRFVCGQVTLSDLSLTLIKIEKSSVKGKMQHHFWVFTMPSEGVSKGWRLEWSCHVGNGISVFQGPTAWGQQWLLWDRQRATDSMSPDRSPWLCNDDSGVQTS